VKFFFHILIFFTFLLAVIAVVPNDECYPPLHPDARDHDIDIQGGPGSHTLPTPPEEHAHSPSPRPTRHSAIAQVLPVSTPNLVRDMASLNPPSPIGPITEFYSNLLELHAGKGRRT
jgi:hypothetical protein